VCPVRYELCFYIPEDDILHRHRREILKSYLKWLRMGQFANCQTSIAPVEEGFWVRASVCFCFFATKGCNAPVRFAVSVRTYVTVVRTAERIFTKFEIGEFC
jgi:hypothetical protein